MLLGELVSMSEQIQEYRLEVLYYLKKLGENPLYWHEIRTLEEVLGLLGRADKVIEGVRELGDDRCLPDATKYFKWARLFGDTVILEVTESVTKYTQ